MRDSQRSFAAAASERVVNRLRSLAKRLDRRAAGLSRERPETLPPAPSVRMVGHFSAATGVGEIARNTLHALHNAGAAVAFQDVEPIPTSATIDVPPPAAELPSAHINLILVNAADTRRVYEKLGAVYFRGRTNIGYWWWEMPRFPQRWHGAFTLYDEIWVGSRYVQSALAAFAPIPVVHMPAVVSPAPPAALSRARFGIPDRRFAFLFMCDACSILERKNPIAVVRAFARAFGRSNADGPVLVLKLNNLDMARRRSALFAHDEQALTALLAALEEVGGVLITERFDRATTSALMQCCDAYVSLHRCEGFGLTMAEAMYFGKPCIATAYSGNLDYMTPSNSFPVGYKLVALERSWGPYEAGDVWAEPDVEHAAVLMQSVIAHPEQALHRGALAARDIRTGWGPTAGSHAMLQRIALREWWRKGIKNHP